MHAISSVYPHNESQNISFITKELYHIKQHHSKPPSHTFINNIIHKLKSVYMYRISTKVEGDMRNIARKQR